VGGGKKKGGGGGGGGGGGEGVFNRVAAPKRCCQMWDKHTGKDPPKSIEKGEKGLNELVKNLGAVYERFKGEFHQLQKKSDFEQKSCGQKAKKEWGETYREGKKSGLARVLHRLTVS